MEQEFRKNRDTDPTNQSHPCDVHGMIQALSLL